ncbi:MAG: PAS domain-containing protein [Candidatus Thorarchaeota archaeon]|nr:PAS domain-containing protein [Candidatus Thorarchaeota archaeon]
MEVEPSLNTQIIKILGDNPIGLTISDISRIIGVSRNTVSKYVQTLEAREEIAHKEVGSAKLFYLASRVKKTRLIDVFPIPLVVVDAKLTIIKSNQSFQLLVGRPNEEIEGQTITEFITRPNKKEMKKVLKECIVNQTPLSMITMKVDKYTYETFLIPVRLENGQIGISIQCIIPLDTHNQLFNNEIKELMTSVIDTFPVFFAIIDATTKQVLIVNDSEHSIYPLKNSDHRHNQNQSIITEDQIQDVVDDIDLLTPFTLAISITLQFKEKFETLTVRRVNRKNTNLLIIHGEYYESSDQQKNSDDVVLQLIDTMLSIIQDRTNTHDSEDNMLREISQIITKIHSEILITGTIDWENSILKLKYVKLPDAWKEMDTKRAKGRGSREEHVLTDQPAKAHHIFMRKASKMIDPTLKKQLEKNQAEIQSAIITKIVRDGKVLFSLAGKFTNKGLTATEITYMKIMSSFGSCSRLFQAI